ncbi:MAG: threonylcarbamoyl-AMP synthase [Gammaproteobacteria bacterium]|nr:threonylcarbamoyl-AMP synthase [Gammaproteobacteria bacterium]
MSQFFKIHPDNPQARLIRQAVSIIEDGGIIVYPTDSCYAIGCHLGDKKAMDRIAWIRQTDARHNFTLICNDLSDIALYARVNNSAFRMLKSLTPGPYTFILKATSEVPRRLQNPKRKTIGLRVPDNAICQALVEQLGQPLMSSTLILPDKDLPETDPEEIRDVLERSVDLIIDGGHCGFEPTTVLALLDDGEIDILRNGRGDTTFLEAG